MTTTSTQPIASACDRLCSDRSMNVAGRKMVGSISTSVRPGRSASRAASTWRVTSSVLPQGCFSTISSRPGPSLMIASPMGGGEPSVTVATSPQQQGIAAAAARIDDRVGQVFGRLDADHLPHGDPLVGRVDEAAAGQRGGVGDGPLDGGRA